jgi:ankyrin repeat protein
MLEAGLPVTATSQHGATPLHWAAFHGNVAMVRAILDHDPPLEARDADFDGTPVGWAVYGSEHSWHRGRGDHGAVVEALIAAGGRPPAQRSGSPAVQDVLRRHGVP